MPRTAPDVTTTATYKRVTFHLIDSTGDKRTMSLNVGNTATQAQVEALADAIGLASNADVYEVSVASVWGVVPDATNALDLVRPSIYSNIVVLLKNAVGDAENVFIPAPIENNFVAGTDNPNPVGSELNDVMSTATTLIQTRYAGAVPVSVRYTERREINSKVNL